MGVRIAIVLALLAGGALAAEEDPTSEARALEAGRMLRSASAAPPPDDAPGWAPVSLPDAWLERRPGEGGLAWYRFEVPGPVEAGSVWGVYLPDVNMNAEAWVNGAPVGSGGSFAEPVARNFNRPLYFAFPSDLLDRPVNVLDVRLFVYAPLLGELGAPWVGPDRALRPRYERAHLARVVAAQVATALCVVAMALSGALWIGSHGTPVYGWFALVTGLWALTSLNYWVRDIPVSVWVWERTMHSALDAFVVALAFWAHRYAGVRRPRLDRALGIAGGAAIATTWLVPNAAFYPVANVVHGVLLPVAAYGTLVVLGHTLRRRSIEALIYVPAGALALVFAIHDLRVQFGAAQADAPYLLPYLVPLLLASFGTTLVLQFASALRSSQTLTRELEARVEEKRSELDRSYEARRRLERATLVAEERERLVREMHDGLGGQLVSVLSLAEADAAADPRVAAGVRAAIDDMRLVIDSLDPGVRTLAGALGAARARFQPALEKNRIALDWQAGDLPPTPHLSPEDYLHVLRIVQEALTNVVRHAGASRALVRSGVAERGGRAGIEIEVVDDGRGIVASGAAGPGGRGLRHMRERAARLSGVLELGAADEATGAGTRVTLWLPGPA